MNYAVDAEKRAPAEVVRGFLDTIERFYVASLDSFKTRSSLTVGADTVSYYSLPALAQRFPGVARLPYSLKVLLENLVRREDAGFVKAADIEALASWSPATIGEKEIFICPPGSCCRTHGRAVRGRSRGDARRHRRARR